MVVPIALFLLTVAGFVLAIGYFAYTAVFGGRLLVRCRVPGDVAFELSPEMSPVRIAAYLSPWDGRRLPVHVELERDGERVWAREVLPEEARGLLDETIAIDRFKIESPARYRLKGGGAEDSPDTQPAIAAIHVYTRSHEPRPAVYVLAGSMLVGGFISLLFVLA